MNKHCVVEPDHLCLWHEHQLLKYLVVHNVLCLHALLCCFNLPCCKSNWTMRVRLYPAAKCKGVDLRPSEAWQLTFSGVKSDINFSSLPDRLASNNSSFLYSPVNTGLVAISATSVAVLHSWKKLVKRGC